MQLVSFQVFFIFALLVASHTNVVFSSVEGESDMIDAIGSLPEPDGIKSLF